jgi:Ser/Thr protein kinase RdoA (MazF antagonist)
MSKPPDVDYTATSVRPSWSALPVSLQRSLAVALGTEIAEAGPSVRSGFTGGFAAPVKLADGREVFVKAADDSMHAYGAYQREAEVVPQLPPAVQVPPVVATAQATEGEVGWFAVAAERIVGKMPGVPWTARDFDTVTATCVTMAEALTPSPLAGLDSFRAEIESPGFPIRLAAEVLGGDRPLPRGFQPWLADQLQEIQDLVDLYPEALAGDAAIHGDLRPDNLLVDADDRCWTLDWNWLSLGPAWFDWLCLLPIAHRDGIDTITAVRTNPLTADVPADHLDCLAAVIAVYMLKNLDAPPPPGCTPELRRHQRLYGWAFLDWLAVRRGW